MRIIVFALTLLWSVIPADPVSVYGAGAGIQAPEKISFATPDGVLISGDLYRPQGNNFTLILLHGLGSNMEEWRPFAGTCSSKGLGVLIYDARGHGKSISKKSGETVNYQYFFGQGLGSDWGKMISDLDTAVQTLIVKYKIPVQRIAVGGASIGANIALRYACDHREVPFALLLSPGINYQGIRSDDAVSGMKGRPVCSAVSSGDGYAYQSVMALKTAAPFMTVFVEPMNEGHGVQMFRRSDPELPSSLEIKLLKWIQSLKK